METTFNPQIVVLTLTFGFALASILGYICYRFKLSPILGYLLAGYIIGPYSPGFVADLKLSEQLAQFGVVLMMFGVGLHIKWQDLIATRTVAIPGAIGLTCISTLITTLLIYEMGWSIQAGIVMGFAISVSSTMVLFRVLKHNRLMNGPEGHISVGWTLVEDVITVIMLLLIPTLAVSMNGGNLSFGSVLTNIGLVILKFIILITVMFTIGRKVVSYVLSKVASTKSNELFTLTILAFTFLITALSYLLLGFSIALGAFIAGLVIGQTPDYQKASVSTTSMQDTFVAIFFLSVGMIFNPAVILEQWKLFLLILAVILILKPLSAFFLSLILRQTYRTALVICLALAQIGEFSFILSEEAMNVDILPDDAYDIIVACSIVSICINPLLFILFKVEPHSNTSKLYKMLFCNHFLIKRIENLRKKFKS